MFGLSSSDTFKLYRYPTDMRKSFDGLCGIVIKEMQGEVTSGEVFIFVNKSRTSVKLLQYQPGGFVIYYKRLSKGRFSLPDIDTAALDYQHVKWRDLVLIIEGIKLDSVVEIPRFMLKKSS
jgi:transposase